MRVLLWPIVFQLISRKFWEGDYGIVMALS